jgi:uncharacterized protein (DUF433 family)
MSTSTEQTKTTHPHVTREAGVQGGRAVIQGTRFPISSIVQNHRRGLTVEEMLREFPQLSPAQVYDALSFYYDGHQDEVDREIEQQRDLASAQKRYPPTLQP